AGAKSGPVDGAARIDARKAMFVSLGVGAGLTVVGAAVTGVGQGLKFGPAIASPASACATDPALIACSERVDSGLELRSAGAGVLGVGVGVAISSVAWWLKPERRRTAWIVEAGVGGAALIGGIVGLAVGSGRVNRANTQFQ